MKINTLSTLAIIFSLIGLSLSFGIIYQNYFARIKATSKPQLTPGPTSSAKPEESNLKPIDPKHFYAPILLYHHVAERRFQNSYYVSPEIFEEQMAWLKENGYKVISLDDIYQAGLGQKNLPEKPLVITFDDGVTDQYTNALPILKKYDYPATFFIKLNNVGKGKGGMTWEQIKELTNAGMTIGSHTVNHDNLNMMSAKTLKYELEESKKTLEDKLGVKIKFLSYPGGAYSDKVIEAAQKAGYLAAVTTRHRVWQEIKNPNDFFRLNRVHIDDEMPTFTQWVQGKNLK